MTNIEEKIKGYLSAGLNMIAVDKHKRPLGAWKQYQTARITEQELITQIADLAAEGIAIICGAISGNLEVIDVDTKYDLSGTLYDDLCEAIPDSILSKLLVIQTKSGGYHMYYRSVAVQGNKKLATRPATAAEALTGDKVLVLIETRGEGGYVVAPPTEGYKTVRNHNIPTLTAEERNLLHNIAASFAQIKDEPKQFAHYDRTVPHDAEVTPWKDYDERGVDDALARLAAAGWREVRRTDEKVVFLRPGKTDSKSSGDFNFRLGWFSVFTTSSEFEPNKAYRPSKIFAILEKITDGKELYRRLRDMGYGKEKAPSRKLKMANVLGKKNDDSEEIDTQTEEEFLFYEQTKNNLKIMSAPFLELLSKYGGFGIHIYESSKDYIFIRVVSGIVEVASQLDMKKFIESYIDTVYEADFAGDLKQSIQSQSDKLFSKGTLEFLPVVDLKILAHTPTSAFYPFKNGVLKITPEVKELIPYDKINAHVWRSHIIDFNYNQNQEIDFLESDFFKFVSKICNDDNDRIIYVSGIIGYLLHTYKDKARPYAVVLAEEIESEDKGGGTGKGIFFRAISKMINTIVVDGKSFKHDKPFLFQRADIDTQLIVIDDCRKAIDFQGFYSHISEGLTIEKKNRDEIHIPYAKSPKFLFSTNYTINIDGNHGRRRARVVEFSNFFHQGNTPLDYFGHMLFDGWNQDQWNEFYSVMALFVQNYLMDGVVQSISSMSIKRKELSQRFGQEFLSYWDDLSKVGEWHSFNDMFTQFLTESEIEKKDYSAKKFSTAIKFACDLMAFEMEVKKNSQNGGKKDVRVFLKSGIKSGI